MREKIEINFETKNFLVMSLDENQLIYDHNCKSDEEMWDAFEMIYEVFPSVEYERMNSRGEEDEFFLHKWFSNIINVVNNVRTFVTNKYLRNDNWNNKFDPIL